MIKKIFIDVDGVIADFDTAALTRLVGEDKIEEAREKREKGVWSIAEGLGISEEEFWSAIDDPEFWRGIKPYRRAVRFIQNISSLAREHYAVEDIFFATSSCGSVHFPSARTQWIKTFNATSGVDIPLLIFQNTTDKRICANSESLLVEDSDASYAAFLEAGGYSVLIPRQWNRGIHNLTYGSVYDQVLDYVRIGLGGLAHNSIDD